MLKWVLAALVLGGLGYFGFTYYQAGFFSAPEYQEGDVQLSFPSGFRGVLRGIPDVAPDRKFLGYAAKNVPSWFEKSWSICRRPSEAEVASFLEFADVGPGGRLEAICEIDADGDVFVRGWVTSVPNL